jgi:hypothetical protein
MAVVLVEAVPGSGTSSTARWLAGGKVADRPAAWHTCKSAPLTDRAGPAPHRSEPIDENQSLTD